MSTKPDLIAGIKALCEARNLSLQIVVETVEAALAAAYRKDYGEPNQNIKVELDLADGSFRVFDVKEVVEDPPPPEEEVVSVGVVPTKAGASQEDAPQDTKESKKDKDKKEAVAPVKPELDENGEPIKKKRFNPKTQIAITEAIIIKSKSILGDIIKTELEQPQNFGRMAAQTAKQVVTQKIREAERMAIHDEFKTKEGEVLIGNVQRKEGRNILIDLEKAIAIMPPDQQVPGEFLAPGQRVKVYVVGVNMGQKGPEIIVSRAHPEFVRRLFETEIPEIASDVIEIKSVAREAGSRTKIAVKALEDDIDPIGSCVGQRGTRVQTIINEINGEKIDIILYNDDASEYISNALSPAKINKIEIEEESKSALVMVADDQLSLAIGRAGQNVRLAAKLTGWKINIKGDKSEKVVNSDETKNDDVADEKKKDENFETGQSDEEVPTKAGASQEKEVPKKTKKSKKDDVVDEKKKDAPKELVEDSVADSEPVADPEPVEEVAEVAEVSQDVKAEAPKKSTKKDKKAKKVEKESPIEETSQKSEASQEDKE